MRVLFICTANVCRSPMVGAILNALAQDEGLDLSAHSAGVAALEGEPMAPKAHAALEEIGVYPSSGHRARQVSGEMLEEADLVLAMGPRHVEKLRRAFGDSTTRGKVYTLPEYVGAASGREEVPDPYGSTMIAFRATVRQLLEYTELLISRLQKGQRPPPS